MNNRPKRKNPRLREYDYSQPGFYFVTISAAERRINLFSQLVPVGAATPGGPHAEAPVAASTSPGSPPAPPVGAATPGGPHAEAPVAASTSPGSPPAPPVGAATPGGPHAGAPVAASTSPGSPPAPPVGAATLGGPHAGAPVAASTSPGSPPAPPVGAATPGGPPAGAPVAILTPLGSMIREHIEKINTLYGNARVDAYAIMPDHVHLIIQILDPAGGPPREAGGPPGVAAPTAAAASATTKGANVIKILDSLKGITSHKAGRSIWQRSFYDHVIRTDADLYNARRYVKYNASKHLLNQEEGHDTHA